MLLNKETKPNQTKRELFIKPKFVIVWSHKYGKPGYPIQIVIKNVLKAIDKY